MTDRKLQQIAVGSYNYRHEAEFAAGFLRDAGIPYVLQIEDPTLGLSATNSATIWVTSVDEKRARRVLEHEMTAGDVDDGAWAQYQREDGEAPGEAVPLATTRQASLSKQKSRSQISKRASDLSLRGRAIAAVGGAGFASALLLDAVRQSPVVWWGVAVVAVLLAVAGLLGRAPEPLRGMLQALSGDAP